MRLLAIDTAANLCAACVWDSGAGQRGRFALDLGKGHAEHLMAVIDAALGEAGMTYHDLQGVAVSVGPGSFTGIRVGVAAARGLAFALSIRAIGVTTLDALAFEARERHPGRPVLAVIDARRDELYVATYDEKGKPLYGPRIASAAEAAALAPDGALLAGSGARLAGEAAGRPFGIVSEAATADIGAYARLALSRGFGGEKPRPLYLRAADAKPQAGFALARRPGR